MSVLVAEVGGTTMRAARYDAGLTARRTAPTPNHLGGVADQAEVLAALAELCAGIAPTTDQPTGAADEACDLVDQAFDVVAVAYPGPIDDKGVVLATPTVVGHAEPFDLRSACAEIWPRSRVVVLNDLTAAGYRYVAGGMRDFAIITVGSGVGHKVFLHGEPLAGARGRGGEIGHLRVDFDAAAMPCDCGGLGHVGALASGRGVTALVARRSGRVISAREVVAEYLAGDPVVTGCVEEGMRYLGVALAAIHVDTGVERIVVQGGFALAMGERWLAEVAQAAAAACWSIGQSWSDILTFGHPDDDSALLGAGWLVTGAGG
jgi:predicted NBD/HSP70 family sugar kinase